MAYGEKSSKAKCTQRGTVAGETTRERNILPQPRNRVNKVLFLCSTTSGGALGWLLSSLSSPTVRHPKVGKEPKHDNLAMQLLRPTTFVCRSPVYATATVATRSGPDAVREGVCGCDLLIDLCSYDLVGTLALV